LLLSNPHKNTMIIISHTDKKLSACTKIRRGLDFQIEDEEKVTAKTLLSLFTYVKTLWHTLI
jgi:hypothetical protein